MDLRTAAVESERNVMFDEFNDLPVHALAVHGAVVLVPLAALLAVLFAVPRTRAWAQWAFPLVAVAAAVSVFVAKQSGEQLERVVIPPEAPAQLRDIIDDHEEAGTLLLYLMVAFAVLAVVAFALARSSDLMDGPVGIVVSVVLVASAGLVAYQTYKVGELGSKAVWNPTGDVDYGSTG
jgi:hypothetical protein